MEENKILDKIRKLLAKAKDEASSDNEAFIFMAKAQELMTKYKLTNKDLDISQNEIVCLYYTSYIKFFNEINHYINTDYLSDLYHCIAKNNFCTTVIRKHTKDLEEGSFPYYRIQCIGKEEDILNVDAQFKFLFAKFFSLSKIRYDEARTQEVTFMGKKIKVIGKYKPINKLQFIRSYLKGTVAGLWEKYRSNRIETDSENALMVSNYNEALVVWTEANIGKLSTVESRKNQINDDAFKKGKEDGIKKSNRNYKRLL